MTDTGYLVWFVATAVMIVTVITIGILAAAELLPRRTHSRDRSGSNGRRAVGTGHRGRERWRQETDQHHDHAA